MQKKKWVPILAVVILLIGVGTSLFLFQQDRNASDIHINGEVFSPNALFALSTEKTIEEYSGIALDHLMIGVGVDNPEGHAYTLIGADGYQKTVT